MKDPDGPYDSIQQAAADSVEGLEGIDEDEKRLLIEKRQETFSIFTGKWLEYGEYAHIEFDTDAGTARLLKRGEFEE